MKRFFFLTAIAVVLWLCPFGTMAQTSLDQAELMKKWLGSGTWQAKYNADTTEVWDCRSYGFDGVLVEVSYLIHGKWTWLEISTRDQPGEESGTTM